MRFRSVAYRLRRFRLATASVVAVALVVGCATVSAPPPAPPSSPVARPNASLDPHASQILAAGDIARCGHTTDEATAALLDQLDGTVVALGDLAYDHGTVTDFEQCYASGWGRHRARTLPVIGNHEYDAGDPSGYMSYFGEAAAPGRTTWYSSQVGGWQVIVLDSNCTKIGGCGEGSLQLEWLRAELTAGTPRCTLVAAHHPRWSSGQHGDHPVLDAFWRLLFDAGADVVLSGHDHDYERFAPLTPDGAVDPERGIRSFVVGTGGGPLRHFVREAAGSEARDNTTHGVLRLDLRPAGYDWEFLPVAGSTFRDAGTGRCH